MSDGEKTLEQMLVELRERDAVILTSSGDYAWECAIRVDGRWKHYSARTPHGAVVQAYRDR